MDKMEELRDWIGELNWEGVGDVLSDVVDKIDELNKPLVVPKGLGEWLDNESLGNEGGLFSIIGRLEDMWPGCNFEEFITDNKKQLIEVILGNRGYEVEKEKMYRVIIPTKDTVWEYYYLDQDGGIDVSNSLKYVDSHTEEFIRSVSDDLWQFAVEVAE